MHYLAWVPVVSAGNTALYITVEEGLSTLMDFTDIRKIQIFVNCLLFHDGGRYI